MNPTLSIRALGTARLALLAAALPSAACNAILGVEDVSLAAPDAMSDAMPDSPRIDCSVSSKFDLITSNPATTILTRRSSDGGPSMLFKLNNDTKPDAFSMMLYDNMGSHGVINTPGSYTVTATDTKIETCGICLLIAADFDTASGRYSQFFMAQQQGSLVLTKADATGLTGRMRQLKFRRVDNSNGVTKEVNDPCTVTIDDVVFDMPYSAATIRPDAANASSGAPSAKAMLLPAPR